MSQLFTWGGQSTGVSALASFLPKNIQDWSPLEWTGWISNYKQGEKTTLRMGFENNSKWNNWQRINFQNIQSAHTTQYQKNKQPNQKVGKRPKQTFIKKTYRWLTNTWKEAQHCSLLEKCNSKLQWDITSHQSEWPLSKSLQTINAGEGVEKRECSCTIGGNGN